MSNDVLNVSPAKKRKTTATVHRWVRYAIQLLFFILAPALFSSAFSGIKYLCTQIGQRSVMEPISFVIQLVAVLAFTVLFGRFFCGYACAFGTLGDYLYNAFDFLRRRTPLPRLQFPTALVRVLSFLKYVVLAGICVACFMGVWASYSEDSPWVAFAAILAGSLDGITPIAIGLLVAIVVGMIVRERFFCQFLCPLGAVFSLMPVLGFSQFTRTRAHCAKNCNRCHEVCPVSIWPDADTIDQGECISCGRCADVCPMNNVNMVAVEKSAAKKARLAEEEAVRVSTQESGTDETVLYSGDANTTKGERALRTRPLCKTREAWSMLRGSEFGYVVFKAVLLLGVCWLVDAVRYVPSFTELFGF